MYHHFGILIRPLCVKCQLGSVQDDGEQRTACSLEAARSASRRSGAPSRRPETLLNSSKKDYRSHDDSSVMASQDIESGMCPGKPGAGLAWLGLHIVGPRLHFRLCSTVDTP